MTQHTQLIDIDIKPVAKNNTYTITVGSPLLRAGLTLSTTTSEKYVESATDKILELVRKINGTS